MPTELRLRRCAVLMIEPRERLSLDIASLLGGQEPLAAEVEWIALAPHLEKEVPLDQAELQALGAIGETPWRSESELESLVGVDILRRLRTKGLVIGDDDADAPLRARDTLVRDGYWRPLSAVAHYFSRWTEAGVNEDVRLTRHRGLTELIRDFGEPPPHLTERVPAERRQALPRSAPTSIDAVLQRRATCRNFDTAQPLPLAVFAQVMQRVFGIQAEVEIVPGAFALKKANPSGGCLHPLETQVLVRNVEGVETGLYHYHVRDHALEPLRGLSDAQAREFAMQCVAAQDFFADAHVTVALVARFRRTFWKYRNHPKAYRAIVLEAGHVSQNLYLTAAELNLGAYVTAAINEVEIEQAFGLDPLQESPLAVCGFGLRAHEQAMLEFDPLGGVWPNR